MTRNPSNYHTRALHRPDPENSVRQLISNLETTYAECLQDNVDKKTLDQLWREIRKLRDDLDGQSAPTHPDY